ncbi:MAG: Gmad2 immunoglobulin-like domain-containing protein [Dehalococcoidia bacterium]
MKTLLALILVACASATLVACGGDDDGATPTPSPEPTLTPGPSAADICGPNPDPAMAAELTISTPVEGDSATSPLIVQGSAPEFEGRVWFRALDSETNVIFDQGGSTNFGHVNANFEETITFAVDEPTDACLEVYLLRPQEGGVTDMVQVPLALLPPEPASGEPTESAAPEPSAAEVCPDNPDPATTEEVVIDAPATDDRVSSPLKVRGEAAAFEAVIQIRVLHPDGTALVDQDAMTADGGTLSPFDVSIQFAVPEETRACLQVFSHSAADGSIINIAQRHIVLLPPQ